MHVGVRRVNAAVASAISHFNQGCAHLTQVVHKLGVKPAGTLQQYQSIQDEKRCARGDAQLQPACKRLRLQRKLAKKTMTVTQERREGQTYGPGMLGTLEDSD